MAQKLYEEANIQDIANAIRAKNGTTTTYKTDEMAAAIRGIETGGGGTSDDFAIKVIEGEGAITELPSGITKIRSYAFQGNTDLSLTSLPSTVTSIGRNAFEQCTNLSLTSIPSSVKSIGDWAFQYCTGLTTLTFKGTPSSIASNAFINCTNITTINVPWADGAVAGAPWGAKNATINYNYTE